MPVWLIVVVLLVLLLLGGTGLFIKGLTFLVWVALALLVVWIIVVLVQRITGRTRL